MLKRMSSWPRLIGVASGVFGAATMIVTGSNLSAGGSLQGLSVFAVLCQCAFLILAFPLYAGRSWARRALLFAAYCFLVAFVIFEFSNTASRYHGASLLNRLCLLVALITPYAFFLAVLHHPDIRRGFQSREASNQALELTSDRNETPSP
jgi:hypothetical protein